MRIWTHVGVNEEVHIFISHRSASSKLISSESLLHFTTSIQFTSSKYKWTKNNPDFTKNTVSVYEHNCWGVYQLYTINFNNYARSTIHIVTYKVVWNISLKKINLYTLIYNLGVPYILGFKMWKIERKKTRIYIKRWITMNWRKLS